MSGPRHRIKSLCQFVPWRVLTWLDQLGVWCWASLVYAKAHGSAPMFKRNTQCARVQANHDGHACLTCYCGFWDAPERNQCLSRTMER